MSGFMSGDGLADRVRDEWHAMGRPSLAELNEAEGIQSYFYIDCNDLCAWCGYAIDPGDLVGVLAEGGHVCPACHEDEEEG